MPASAGEKIVKTWKQFPTGKAWWGSLSAPRGAWASMPPSHWSFGQYVTNTSKPQCLIWISCFLFDLFLIIEIFFIFPEAFIWPHFLKYLFGLIVVKVFVRQGLGWEGVWGDLREGRLGEGDLWIWGTEITGKGIWGNRIKLVINANISHCCYMKILTIWNFLTQITQSFCL